MMVYVRYHIIAVNASYTVCNSCPLALAHHIMHL